MANISGRVKQWLRGIVERGKKQTILNLLAPQNKGAVDFLSGLFPAGVSDVELMRRIVGWVYVCITINAQSVASIPIRLYSMAGRKANRGWRTYPISPDQRQYLADVAGQSFSRAIVDGVEVEEITGKHPWNKIVSSPNEVLEWFDVLELTVMWRQATGDAFWYQVQDGLGVPREIWPLLPHRMKLVSRPKQPVAGWTYEQSAVENLFQDDGSGLNEAYVAISGGGNGVFLPASDVIHFRRVNPLDPYGRGLSPIRAGLLSIDTLVLMEEYSRRLVEGDGTPSFILYNDEGSSVGFARRVIDEWMKLRKDFPADAPGALPGGWKAQVIGLSPKEMAYREGVENYLKETAAIFGVPWAFLDTRNVNKANDQASDYRHKKGTIKPICTRLASEINKSLIWPFFGEDLFVAFDECVPEDARERTERNKVLVQGGIMTPNEARRSEKLPPINEKWADELWMQGATQPMSTLYKMGEAPKLPFPSGPKPSFPPAKPNQPKPNQPPQQKSLTCDHDHRILENDPYKPRAAMVEALKTYFNKQRDIILSNLERSDGKHWTRDREPFGDDWDDELANAMNPHVQSEMRTGAADGMKRIAKATGIPVVDFDLERPEAKAFLQQHQINLRHRVWNNVNETTHKAITTTLAEGMSAGETLKELAARVNVVYDEAEGWRAYMVARTETARAQNAGAELSYAAAGLEEKEWLVAFGACEICEPYNGDIARVGESFERSGLMGPPAHPNCFSEDTEVFTAEGWKSVSDVSEGDFVWTMRMNDRVMELDVVKNAWSQEHNGEMVNLKSRTLDLLVTPDHAIAYVSDWHHKHNKNELKRKPVSEISKSDSLPRIAEWSGSEPETIDILGCGFPAKDFVRFMGWYVAEGCISKPRNGSWQISIAQEKEENKAEIRALADKLFPVVWKSEEKTYVPLDWDDLIEWFCALGHADTKHFPRELMDLGSNLLREMFDAYIAGDGHIRKNEWKGHPEWDFGNEISAATISPRLAADLTEIGQKIGLRTSFHITQPKPVEHKNGTYTSKYDLIRVSFGSKRWSTAKVIDNIPYVGLVYGIEMEDNPVVLVRRNGKTVWTGNCRCTEIPVVRETED